MKKLILCVAAFAALFISTTALANDISITINGEELVTDNAPVIVNDRTLVPMRAIFEALGAEVTWNEQEYCAYASKDSNAIRLPIGSDIMGAGIVNSGGAMLFSSEIALDVPAQLIGDFTYVPARAVAEAFKSSVNWNESERRVIITDAHEGSKSFFYTSADDYSKLYRVDSNGVKRQKLSDREVREVYYDEGYVYYVTSAGHLYRQPEHGGAEEQITGYNTEVVSIENGRIFCLKKEQDNKGELYEYGLNGKFLGSVMYPEKHGSYIYYNRDGDTRMFALNIDTYEETAVEMVGGLTLSPFNCVFYAGYILVENGHGYQNIYRFNADGSDLRFLNSNHSFICRNQQEDARVLYVNGDNGQDIYYVWIDGSYNGMVVDMPEDCAWADVLLQDGDYIYYKNMYRGEIYRTDFNASENTYVGYGDSIKVYGDMILISGDGLYRGNLDGSNQVGIYNRPVSDYFAHDNTVYTVDGISGNIVKIDHGANAANVTNDRVIAYADNFEI